MGDVSLSGARRGDGKDMESSCFRARGSATRACAGSTQRKLSFPDRETQSAMKLARPRANVLALTLTAQELAALFAAARMALDALRADPQAPRQAIATLERIVHDYDRAIERLDGDGRR